MANLMTYREVADRLSLSEAMVRRLTREGTLPCVRVSERRTRFDPVAIERWVAERSKKAAAA